jgi:hypothetical protein
MNKPIEISKVQMNGEVTVTVSYKVPEKTTLAATLDEEVIKQAVNRFLVWQLPRDFYPDGGVQFHPAVSQWPTGTNLLTAEQAKTMFEHCLRKDTK